MARRTVDLLPEIFRTPTNQKFLSATLDQLTQEPRLNRTRGYVGRRVGPGVNPADNYVVEPTAARTDYQLEPGVVFLKPDTNTVQDTITYPGFIDALALQGANTSREDRLFESEYYTWDPFCDLDKFTNYSQYYWLPQGPSSVDVGATAVAISDDFTVTRNTHNYQFSGVAGTNPVITLVRGGNYRFEVNQPGHEFYIQAAPGINGRMPATPNISSRDVLGVSNNGEDGGTVTFDVPLATAQDYFYGMPEINGVELVSTIKFDQINNVYLDEFLEAHPNGIDGITALDGRTVVFNIPNANPVSGGWLIIDPDTGAVTEITSLDQKYGVWKITYSRQDPLRPRLVLQSILTVPRLSRFRILSGTVYSSTQWYRDSSGLLQQMPLLTAVQDTLYYQDGSNPEIFGEIRLIDFGSVETVRIDDIVGAINYTSPNGVVFTNGLKVQFRGPVEPAQFQDQEFYVEGVGTGLGVDQRVGFVNGEGYFGPWHLDQGRRLTGLPNSGVFQQFIYDTVEESLANVGSGAPLGAPLPVDSQAGVIIGNGIKLIPVQELVTPETYTRNATVPYDSTTYDAEPYDAALNAPLVQDYITINRASRDRNAWSRSNRWFHIDVIRYSAERNNLIPIIDNQARGKRPIIEFRGNLELFNFGTQGKLPVNVIDFEITDALSLINGQIGYAIDGYQFISGSRVIFGADTDASVRNRIYEVTFIDPDGNPNSAPIINLVPVTDGVAQINNSVVCLSGIVQQGLSFWFDGINWRQGQLKTNVNQPPLFDVRDAQGRSFSDAITYPSSTFQGSRLFGYALGNSQVPDEVLGFALRYLNINNVGDIVFENYFYNDVFEYVADRVGTSLAVSTGFVRQYIDQFTFSELIGWQPAAAENRSRQIFRFIYSGEALVFDIPMAQDTVYPGLQIFAEGIFVEPNRYTVTVTGLNTLVEFSDPPPLGSVIEAQMLSDQASSVGFYQVPINLENNPLNADSPEFTLGTIRTHYESIGQNLIDIQGPIVGANNSRDLGNILRYGENIVQHSAPLTLTGVFLRQQQFEAINAIVFNNQEYNKYKARLLDLAGKGDFVNLTASQVLDAVMQEISVERTDNSPFYWSDMIPAGETYTETVYTYSFISTDTFDTIQTYDFSSANFRAILIWVNDVMLTRGYDYEVGDGTPTVTITAPLTVGDKIRIREYPTTFGSFVPNTPSKMGLYPLYRPEIYVDESYIQPTTVIRGHDGSITVAFGDSRDEVLLEFETRIFNNVKMDSNPVPLTLDEVVPGQFRDTAYSLAEINEILSQDFLSWVGWNKLDYLSQDYISTNAFTYNYSQSSDRLDGSPLLGAWRGIYNYFYDTIAPNTRPWEMLGFSQEPDWWQTVYGPAPYTSGNLVLWDDLAQGLVNDPAGPYVLPRFRRPGLTRVIPSGSEGTLLDPLLSTVGNYDAASFRRSWVFGDDGPVENTWRTSSAWPFAVMRLLCLTRPAKFFSLFADRDRYRFNTGLEQYLWDERYHLDAKDIAPLYGQGVSKASYINWILDYNQQLGINSNTTLTTMLDNIDIRLCWRLGAFSDKRYLKIFSERSTPTSLNASLLLPDESYQLLLYSNVPFEQLTYSSVIVQRTEQGWIVLGYNTAFPYFNILTSRPNGTTTTISAGGSTVRVSTQYSDQVVKIPYGYQFTNRAALCDFLLSYGRLLERQGMIFDTRENGYLMDWSQMAREFLYWSNQGWTTGSMINLNPAARQITVARPGAVAESLVPPRLDNLILNQNRQVLPISNLVIDRIGNSIKIVSTTTDTINYVNLRFTAYEHIIVLDNTSIFADLIYDPRTGARQSRLLVSGALSADWNGTVNAPGFILNQDNIQEWQPNRKYVKGEIVLFKDEYWAASTIINPSQEFDYGLWIRSDYDEIQRGLLPNAANASDQLINAYDIYDANLEQEVDLFSYGLIGFRPREYMQALNLDDVSQVNLYQQFLGTKGTIRSAELFNLADLGKETAEYNIYEYWAILLSLYGANGNRSYFELLLDQASLQSDPSVIQVIQPGQASQADQTVLVQSIWKSSYKINDANILPTLSTNITDRALPSAGYVNLDDVDVTVFDLFDTNELTSQLDQIGVGTTIWVARTNAYDWNVYNVTKVPGEVISVADNLDERSVVTMDQEHGLAVGDILIIRFFDDRINGAYRVLAVPSLFTVLIQYQFEGRQTNIVGEGVAFTLDTARVRQPSDIPDLPYAAALGPGAKVWIDNDGQQRWTVLEKSEPYRATEPLSVQLLQEQSGFGSSVSQGFFNLTALVGAPTYNPAQAAEAPGAVYVYFRNDRDEYEQNSLLTLGATDTAGYGSASDIGDQQWAIVGAPGSGSNQGYAAVLRRAPGADGIEQTQLLVAPDLEFGPVEFGAAVNISQDERWLYVGSPGANRVYAFARVDTQTQTVSYVTDGTNFVYDFSQNIVITEDQQITVILNDQILEYGIDYNVNNDTVVLDEVPEAGLTLLIARNVTTALDQQLYPSVTQDSTSGLGTGAVFSVFRQRGAYYSTLIESGEDYAVSDTITIDAATIGGGSSPANDLVITVTAVDGDGGIVAFTPPATVAGVTTTAVFPLNPFLVSANSIWSFTVTVDGKLYRPEIDYDFNSDSALDFLDIVFTTIPPPASDIVVSAKDYFTYVETITVPGLAEDAQFGYTVSTTTDGRLLQVGAPGTNNGTGSVYVFDRSVERFLINAAVTSQQFTTVNSLVSPTAVTVNGEFLLNTELNIGGNFTVTGANSLTANVALAVGDTVEIETNQFTLVQEIAPERPYETGQFGYRVDQCVNDCSLYMSAPFDGTNKPEAGHVEFWQNQARVFGLIESTIANPVLTAGNYIRINNYMIECTGTAVSDLVADIREANVPNVVANASDDLQLVADGLTSVFDVGNIYSSASSYTTRVLLNDVVQTEGVDYTYNNNTQQITFTDTPNQNDIILVVSGRLVLTVKNFAAAPVLDKLQILPGTGTLWQDLGVPLYVWQQTIQSPIQQDYAQFGSSIFISDDTVSLLVGAPGGSLVRPTTFDSDTTVFDARSTTYFDQINQSGVVYSFDLLPSASLLVTDPSQFVFGQQIYDDSVQSLDRYGAALDFTTGVLLAGAPGADFDDSQSNYGQVLQFVNPGLDPAWRVLRLQQPVVDINLLNTIYTYDRFSGNKQYFDYFDPLQGRLLGVVGENIDYIGSIDPAAYNVGPLNNLGQRWGQLQVGQIWWNTDDVRFIDPNQDDVTYASRRWGQTFPGSTVNIFQWISSTVPPAQYAGPGTVRSVDSYAIAPVIDDQGLFSDVYFFWVSGLRTVDRAAGKTLSAETLARYIENPRGSGIAYLAPLSPSTVALYNALPYITAQDTVLSIEFDQKLTDDAVHVEYQLIPENRADGFLGDLLFRKFLDSMCGTDSAGNLVPDPKLPPADLYGVSFRPRQSMFVNRFQALQNYLQRANAVMLQFPISEIRDLSILNSFDPEPSASSGEWDQRLANINELFYQNIDDTPIGYRYLITSDSTIDGQWSIYEVVAGDLPNTKVYRLYLVQNYDTRLFWQTIDWYAPGYDPLTRILVEVPNFSALDTITVPTGSSVKVTANAKGNWEIYIREPNSWTRVGLQAGTIEFLPSLWNYTIGRFGFDSEVYDSQYYDEYPTVETRRVLESINQEILIDDLAIERNRLLILMFNYILSEQSPEWLKKTSLIDVEHVIRQLEPFQIYRQDNQDFVLQYINEVKPYRTQIREFNLIYRGQDQYQGSMVDFDLPAYWDPAQNLFVSPVLDNTGRQSTTSSVPSTSALWQTFPYDQWFNNYRLTIESVKVLDGGSGYITAPQVTVLGSALVPAVMQARINSAGRVISIDVINPGEGYVTQAVIEFSGGAGTGARAVAVMDNPLVREIKTTIRYDRYQYRTDILTWTSGVIYTAGQRVRYDDRVWQANENIQSQSFNPENWTLIPAADLSGVDRTMGYYAPDADQPGLDLALLISGVDYPGVQVKGPGFDQNTGFDVGNYDINPYDNISFGPEGFPTYAPELLDAIYASDFLDPFLGTLPSSINVDGGAFVDTYSSHAPEELVPGAIFDTLDFRVYTTPGAGFAGLDHGFPLISPRFVFDASEPVISFAGYLDYPVSLTVFNLTQGTLLSPGVNYVVSWEDLEVELVPGAALQDQDIVVLTLSAFGGGNQLYNNSYLGSTLLDDSIVIPRQFADIYQIVIFVNGAQTTDFTFESFGAFNTIIRFGTGLSATDRATVCVLGFGPFGVNYSWSLPLTQYIVANGVQNYTINNSLQGTNPINTVVTVNGLRARPSETVQYISDGSSVEFLLPARGNYPQNLIADNDVSVYINNTALVLGVDFVVSPVDGLNTRYVTLSQAPEAGSSVLVAVRSAAQYWIVGNQLVFRPTAGLSVKAGDLISITTWNDTAEQNLVTQVYVGPTQTGVQVVQGYDTTLYDEGTVTGDPGSYSYAQGEVISRNRFNVGRPILNSDRIIVSVNGKFLFSDSDFIVDGSTVEILGPTLSSIAVVVITLMTQTVVPAPLDFRIFQDMRGLQTTYRITANTTTSLAAAVSASADSISVVDASRLSEPNLPFGIFGLVTINGERIAYRERNLANNTISGLRRGTAGTGAAAHAAGSAVYDIGLGNVLPAEYQDRVVFDNFLADGTQTLFVAESINLDDLDSTELVEAVLVYVGGTQVTSGYTVTDISPLRVLFDTAPTAGYQVSIRVRQGLSWYQPAATTPSNGVPLQQTSTEAARFLRGN